MDGKEDKRQTIVAKIDEQTRRIDACARDFAALAGAINRTHCLADIYRDALQEIDAVANDENRRPDPLERLRRIKQIFVKVSVKAVKIMAEAKK